MQKKELCAVPAPVLDTYALTVCALLTALSVVLARLLTIIPSEVSRFSLEAVPILLAGLLFGPLPGAAVGFAADFIGCLFSPFGYNPIFCLPPILYGLWAGLVCLAQAYPLAGGAGGISCGGMRLRALAEHGSGAGVRWCSQMALFPHPAGGPQRAVRHHRLYRRAAGVAADAAKRTLPGTAADKDEGR